MLKTPTDGIGLIGWIYVLPGGFVRRHVSPEKQG